MQYNYHLLTLPCRGPKLSLVLPSYAKVDLYPESRSELHLDLLLSADGTLFHLLHSLRRLVRQTQTNERSCCQEIEESMEH